MQKTRIISLLVIMTMMIGQIVIAQHHSAHVSHDVAQESNDYSHNDHDHGHAPHKHDEEKNQHDCPECLLSQSLQIAFHNVPVTLFVNLTSEDLTRFTQQSVVIGSYYNPNAPRAPPFTLI